MTFQTDLRAAVKIDGTPDELAVRLRRLLDIPRRNPALVIRANGLRLRLAHLYGLHRGWRLSENEFQPSVLARRGRSMSGFSADDCWPPQFISHPYIYRRDRRAAALVCHSLVVDAQTRAAMHQWVTQKGLAVSFPEDFPSWWYPNSTTMVVFEPAAPAAN